MSGDIFGPPHQLPAEFKDPTWGHWSIINEGRYGDLGHELPKEINVHCELGKARLLAERISNWYPGCDYIFYVEGDDND